MDDFDKKQEAMDKMMELLKGPTVGGKLIDLEKHADLLKQEKEWRDGKAGYSEHLDNLKKDEKDE